MVELTPFGTSDGLELRAAHGQGGYLPATEQGKEQREPQARLDCRVATELDEVKGLT